MSNLLLLVTCLAIGMLLHHSARIPANTHQALNAVILHVSLPAVTLRALHGFVFDPSQLWPVLMPWALFAFGAGTFWAIGRWLRLPLWREPSTPRPPDPKRWLYALQRR